MQRRNGRASEVASGSSAATDLSDSVTRLYPTADPECVRYHRRRMMLWPTDHLIEELHVLDAFDAMAALDEQEYSRNVIDRSTVELASQRAAIEEILDYRERSGVDVPMPNFGIPREIIDEIKTRRPVEHEVTVLTDLKRSGISHRGTCPICPGRSNPSSLAVWPERGSWHCFRCDVGGDVIAWVMASANLDFPDAVRYLCDTTGVRLPEERQRIVGSGTVSLGTSQ